MPLANVRGVNIHYEVLGAQGPWVALSPGGRLAIDNIQSLAQRVADAGYRVLLHDRRNCGASDVVIEGSESEHGIWADDLHELLSQLKALPAWIGGRSSGCRLSILFALRYPQAVRGLLLWRVTGGGVAASSLARQYYGDFIEAAQKGGMAAVCESEFFRKRIEARPANRERLMKMDPKHFIGVMSNWSKYFTEAADLPIIGATENEIRSIKVPACVVPGNDQRHPPQVGENLSRLLPNCELHRVMTKFYDQELSPNEEWDDKHGVLTAVLVDFLRRAKASGAV